MFVKEMTVTMTTQTTATSKSKKWLWIRFFKILPLQLRKKKTKSFLSRLRIRGHLCKIPHQSLCRVSHTLKSHFSVMTIYVFTTLKACTLKTRFLADFIPLFGWKEQEISPTHYPRRFHEMWTEIASKQ